LAFGIAVSSGPDSGRVHALRRQWRATFPNHL
jgi:hypothetical protein